MPIANVTVAYVNPPKPGQKVGNIKTNTGEYYRVWNDKLQLFQQNGQYTIEYTDESYNGKAYKMFSKMVGAVAVGSNGAAPTQVGASATGATNFTKSEEMFVMGLIGRCIQGTGGLPDEDTLYNWVLACRGAWRAMAAPVRLQAAPQAQPLQHNELNDEIPF